MTHQSYIDLFCEEISTYKGVIFYIGSFPYNLYTNKSFIIPFKSFDDFNLYLKQHPNIIGKSILFISEPNTNFESKDIETISSLKPTYVFLDYYKTKSGSWMLRRWLKRIGIDLDYSYDFNSPSPVEYKYIPIFETTNENDESKRSWLILARGEEDKNSFKLNFPYNI